MTDMQMTTRQQPAASAGSTWFLGLGAAVLVAELLALYFLYHPDRFVFECRAYASPLFCGFLSAGVMRAGAVAGAVILYLLARPRAARTLAAHVRPGWVWGMAQLIGIVLILTPLAILAEGAAASAFTIAAVLWVVGGLAFVAGTLFFVAPPTAWVAAARTAGPGLAVIVLAALTLPDIAPWIRDKAQFLWHLNIVTEATFWSVASILKLFGEEVFAQAEGPWTLFEYDGPYLGIGEFIVGVGRQCSGVEGFILISGFLGLYFWLFRDQLRFPRVLILLPIGIALSWCLNVVRIAVLIWIGAYHSPELAIEGFHSHAGWLMFTMLAVSFAATAHQIAWFRRSAAVAGPQTATRAGAHIEASAPRSERTAFFADPIVAQILPFIVFMASALLASTFFQTPAVAYPLRALAMAAGLVVFWRVLATLDWRVDLLSVGAGVGIGVLWLVTTPAADTSDSALAMALAEMPLWLFVVWVVSRVIGTSVLVPLIEELFFRGYILTRLDTGGLLMRLVALAVSTGLFAALHDRWLAAALAGVVFGLLFLRRGKLADAIYAHAAANAVIAGWAVSQGDWSVI